MDQSYPQPQYVGPGGAMPQPPVQRIVIEQPRRGLGAGGWFLLLAMGVMLAGSAFMNLVLLMAVGAMGASQQSDDRLVDEKFHSLSKSGDDKVAIISVEGAILDGEGFVKHQIERVRHDENVKALVLRVDSPGGTVTGSDYIYHHLKKVAAEKNIPMVVSMGSLAASGGYYVAMAAGDAHPDLMFAEPTTWTGSIGVIIPHFDVAGLMKKWEIQENSIASHPLKGMGSPLRELKPEERDIFQSLVDDGFRQFKDVVKSGRKRFRENPEDLDKIATGQVFTASQAVENGLVDKIGFIEDAVDRAIELAGLNRSDVKVVKYEQPMGVFDLLAGGRASAQPWNLKTIVELATPRAYYLCTALPLAVTSDHPSP